MKTLHVNFSICSSTINTLKTLNKEQEIKLVKKHFGHLDEMTVVLVWL